MLALTTVGFGAGLLARRGRARPREPRAGIPATALPGFLVAVGLLSTSVYALVACSQITQATLRYDLLVLYLPVGALLGGLTQPTAAVRAGLVTATVLWAGLNLDDYGALTREIRASRWPDHRGDAVAALEARGLQALWGDFRLAYVLSFRSQERLTVASTTVHRIDEYVRLAAERDVPMVKQGICDNGSEVVTGIWLCPTPPPEARPPVY